MAPFVIPFYLSFPDLGMEGIRVAFQTGFDRFAAFKFMIDIVQTLTAVAITTKLTVGKTLAV